MKRNLCRIGLALVISLLSAAASAETSVRQYEGTAARAFFDTLDPSGCIETWVDVYLFDSSSRILPSPQQSYPWLIFFMGREDVCQSVTLNMFYGSALLSEGDYSISGTHSARVSRSLEASDFNAGITLPLRVEIVWEGQGNPEPLRNHGRIISPGFKWIHHSQGIMRDAVATGNVFLGTEMLTPAPAAEAHLGSVQQGEIYIHH